MKFEELNLIEPILKAVDRQGYTIPTPIQEQAIPIVLEGKDLLGCAQTGTGKTAAFAIPILQLLYKAKERAQNGPQNNEPDSLQNSAPDSPQNRESGNPRNHPRNSSQRLPQEQVRRGKTPVKVLVMTPTRELAIQIDESFSDYGRFTGMRHTVVFGGVSQNAQTNALKSGVDILIATPGRLLDLIGQGFIQLNSIEIFVLDEADRMLDMGFAHDMKKVIAMLPTNRQTLLFSATMPGEITNLVNVVLKDPVKVEVTPPASTVDLIDQAVYFVEKKDKKFLLNRLLENKGIDSALIFTRTKHGADKVVKDLASANIIAQAIHGNKSQAARQLALSNFKLKQTRVLVATDIAARGIDVRELTHVINYDLPNIPETYVHRIGRTGRAGLVGTAISFCDVEEREYLRDIQKLISKKIDVVADHPYRSTLTESELLAQVAEIRKNQPQSQGSRQPQQSNGQQNRSSDGRQSRPASGQQNRSSDGRQSRPAGRAESSSYTTGQHM